MRLILVHGVAQGATGADAIKATWLDSLQRGGVRPSALAAAQPDFAWYGDLLAAGTGRIPTADLPEQHGAKADFLLRAAAELNVASGALFARALAANPGELEFDLTRQVFGQIAAGHQALSLGQVIEGLGDTFDYLTQCNLRRAIDARVAASLVHEPQTIVAHSLGSVVAYRLLRDGKFACRRLITIGSPLTFASVRGLLDGPFSWPDKLNEWRNGYDRFGPICLGGPFRHHPSWNPRIAQLAVNNAAPDNHAATGYMELPAIAGLVDTVL